MYRPQAYYTYPERQTKGQNRRLLLSNIMKFGMVFDEVSIGEVEKGAGGCGKDSEEVGVPTFFQSKSLLKLGYFLH